MIGAVSIGGIYIPALLLLSLLALALTSLLTRTLAVLGIYRFLACRPLVDGALLVLLLGLLTFLSCAFTSPP